MKRHFYFSIMILLTILCWQAPAVPGRELALINGILIDGTGSEPVVNAAIIIHNDRINRSIIIRWIEKTCAL